MVPCDFPFFLGWGGGCEEGVNPHFVGEGRKKKTLYLYFIIGNNFLIHFFGCFNYIPPSFPINQVIFCITKLEWHKFKKYV